MPRLLASAALLAFAAACSPADAPTPPASDSGPVLSYTDAFVMEPIGARDMTMGGLILSVKGGDVTLNSASSTSIGTIEMHTMAMTDGRMQMRQVDSFEIADGEALELKRGGNHFMMFDVGEDVVSGETIDITLNLDAGGEPMTLVVEADVRAVGE
ncbi:MAG: copper chaperone PCu(A)C [Henriciella sp.]|nr:copper chaperone PCu(A)C [Henriciella sp.]MBO6695611.1 copper chaperone PCu(A)C [Henriciella sp.]